MSSLVSSTTLVAVALPLTYVAWRLSGRYLYAYLARKATVVYEIKDLAVARPESKRIKGTAVIIGGSIAGLWTARVASDHFENVLIVEPETWLTGVGARNQYNAEGAPLLQDEVPIRSRVAQYNFVHNFQSMSYHALKRFFPNFDHDVKEANGRIEPFYINCIVDGKEILRFGKHHPNDESSRTFFISRDGYERLLRRLVLSSSSRIKWMTGTVTKFNVNPEDISILSSVDIRLPDGTRDVVPAALVADCSGATQIGLKVIHRIASEERIQPPADKLPWHQTRISYDSGVRYTTFRFHIPIEARDSFPIPGGYHNSGWFYTALPVPGKMNLAFATGRAEGHRIELFFGGWGEPQLPESIDDILDWCKAYEVNHPKIPDWLYTILNELFKYRDRCQTFKMRTPDQQWTRWEDATYVPSNFVAIGDSVQANNPMYGQGCSKAAMGAIILDSMLRKKPYCDSTSVMPDFGRQFFKRQKEVIEPLWEGTKPSDYMFPTTQPIDGETLDKGRSTAEMGNLLMEVATFDDEVDNTLLDVRMFMAPPQVLFKPRFILKYAVFALRKRFGLVPAVTS